METNTLNYFIMFEGTYDSNPEHVNKLLTRDEDVTVHAWDDNANTVIFEKTYTGTFDDYNDIFETATRMAQALDFLTSAKPINVNLMDTTGKESMIIWEAENTEK